MIPIVELFLKKLDKTYTGIKWVIIPATFKKLI